MGAYADKMAAIAEAEAMAGQGPVAWAAPPENMSWDDLSIIESEEGVVESGVGGSVSQPYNPAAAGLGAYFSNVYQTQLEILAQQEPHPKPREVGPEFEYTTAPPGDIITNPPPNDGPGTSPNDYWWQRYDPSLLLPSNWMREVRKYLAAQEAAKEGGGMPVQTADEIKGGAAHVGEVGKDVMNVLAPPTDPANPFSWLGTNTGLIVMGVGGLLLLVLIIK